MFKQFNKMIITLATVFGLAVTNVIAQTPFSLEQQFQDTANTTNLAELLYKTSSDSPYTRYKFSNGKLFKFETNKNKQVIAVTRLDTTINVTIQFTYATNNAKLPNAIKIGKRNWVDIKSIVAIKKQFALQNESTISHEESSLLPFEDRILVSTAQEQQSTRLKYGEDDSDIQYTVQDIPDIFNAWDDFNFGPREDCISSCNDAAEVATLACGAVALINAPIGFGCAAAIFAQNRWICRARCEKL
jgi:hypothetical protein